LADFRIVFNRGKQFLDVYLYDVHPNTFANWGAGRWGYFIAKWENPRIGFFGEIHLVKSRIREDLIVHELFHVLVEWAFAKGGSITRRNEERMAELLDELTRKFYREYKKIK